MYKIGTLLHHISINIATRKRRVKRIIIVTNMSDYTSLN